jgi:Ca2+-binding RTX toxin-like protein
MRRIALLLMVMASTLLLASGVAWAVTKTCPTAPKLCKGTGGADVLKGTSKDNDMLGKGGNDTYTNFVRGNSGVDEIFDSGGKDKLVLTAYSKSEVLKRAAPADYVTNNGKADSLVLPLDRKGKNGIIILGYYDDTKSKAPWRPGVGYIEVIQFKK